MTLVHPQHTRVRPGHKTDRDDAAWLADLLRHGMVQASFITPAEIRALRELTRYRANLVRARGKEVQPLLKTLAAANRKRDAVAGNVVGARGWRMRAAPAAGEADPATLAQMARARLRAKLAARAQAFIGRVTPHHRLLIQAGLDHLRFLERAIEQLDLEVARAVPSCSGQVSVLDGMPGIGPVAAAAIVAEIGVDMGAIPTDGHLAGWTGVCPGNKQSGGRRLSSAATKGNVRRRRILGEVA